MTVYDDPFTPYDSQYVTYDGRLIGGASAERFRETEDADEEDALVLMTLMPWIA